MSEQQLQSSNRTVQSKSSSTTDQTRKNVLWSATLELPDRSVDCVITSIAAVEATIYLSQWTRCRGPITLQNEKLGSISGDVVAQDEKQVTLALHETAQPTITRILAAI